MSIQRTLCDIAEKLSEENYDESFAQYRFWLDIGITRGRLAVQDQVDGDMWKIIRSGSLKELVKPAVRLFIWFIGDVEAARAASGDASSLHMRYCTSRLDRFFDENLDLTRSWNETRATSFLTDMNLIAHWVNLGYVEEAMIRNYILQSLTSHPKLHSHQADALITLFKLAGVTFEAYADTSVVDRCFELLKGHYSHDSVKGKLVKVCLPHMVKGNHRSKTSFQEVVASRESDWEGLPPPPAFTTGESAVAGVDHRDPAATPVIISLGLPSGDLEPRNPLSPPLEPITTETEMSPRSPAPHSPSISITTMSDFAATDDDEPLLDPKVITPHCAFYFEDGNVEVLCGNTLFRVHTSILSLHSPVLGRMFAKGSLTTAESPNGCPRIPSSDAAADFTTLLKIIYLPTYATLPMSSSCSADRLSTGSLNGIRCRTSPHSHRCSKSQRSTRYLAFDPRCSMSSVMRTQRLLGGSLLPSYSERESLVGRLLTQTRSSTSLSSRTSLLHYRWHTTWQPEGDWIH